MRDPILGQSLDLSRVQRKITSTWVLRLATSCRLKGARYLQWLLLSQQIVQLISPRWEEKEQICLLVDRVAWIAMSWTNNPCLQPSHESPHLLHLFQLTGNTPPMFVPLHLSATTHCCLPPAPQWHKEVVRPMRLQEVEQRQILVITNKASKLWTS